MPRTLTCWKEIARYVGKGLRTVQRWEQEMGLPVRRPPGHCKGVVLADSDEIDAWMQSFESGSQSEVAALRKELAALRKENQLLRVKLERAERTPTFVQLNGPPDMEDWMSEVLHKRFSHAAQINSIIRMELADAIQTSRNIRELRRKQREQSLKPSNALLIH